MYNTYTCMFVKVRMIINIEIHLTFTHTFIFIIECLNIL